MIVATCPKCGCEHRTRVCIDCGKIYSPRLFGGPRCEACNKAFQDKVEQAVKEVGARWHKGEHTEIQESAPEAAAPALESIVMTPQWPAILGELQAEGWRVAIHNDYIQNGRLHTFWLLTQTRSAWGYGGRDIPCDGVFVIGEGESNEIALHNIRRKLKGELPC